MIFLRQFINKFNKNYEKIYFPNIQILCVQKQLLFTCIRIPLQKVFHFVLILKLEQWNTTRALEYYTWGFYDFAEVFLIFKDSWNSLK